MKLTRKQISAQIATLHGWRLQGRRISRLFVFEDFMQGMRFLNRVAKLAEAMKHHPDVDIRYNRIRISLTTHDESGLTNRDFKLAKRIDQLRQ